MHSSSFIIAIDGPAASGKGTLARRLGAHFGFEVLDTGLLYRAVAYRIISSGQELHETEAIVEAARQLDMTDIPKPILRSADMGEAASVVAVIPEVRAALVEYQRRFSRHEPGTILDGRDIGTFICPNANIKLFITASAQARAQRRTQELLNSGEDVSEENILSDILKRDERDATRAIAPLKPAEDALIIDTTGLTVEAVFQQAVTHILPAWMAHNNGL